MLVSSSFALRLLALLLILATSVTPFVQAQDPASQQSAAGNNASGKGEWVIAPIPVTSPAIGAGLAWVAGYVTPLRKDDKLSPPSMFGAGGLFTNNGSRGLAIGTKLYLKEDKYRVTFAAAHASINFDLFGVGKLSGDRGLSIPVNMKGSGFFTEPLFQLRKGIYFGARVQYRSLRLSIDDELENNPPSEIADIVDVTLRWAAFSVGYSRRQVLSPARRFPGHRNRFFRKSPRQRIHLSVLQSRVQQVHRAGRSSGNRHSWDGVRGYRRSGSDL